MRASKLAQSARTASDMSGQIALVTGASGVIGSGVAWALLQRGCTVVAPCRTEDAVRKLKKEVGEHDAHQLVVSIADISDEYACRDLAQTIKDKYGQIDHAVSVVGGFATPGALPRHIQPLLVMRCHATSSAHLHRKDAQAQLGACGLHH